jgi:hypothetical protein
LIHLIGGIRVPRKTSNRIKVDAKIISAAIVMGTAAILINKTVKLPPLAIKESRQSKSAQ